MADTNALFLATEEYGQYPSDTAQGVEDLWNDDVQWDGDYDINISVDGYIALHDPSTLDSALDQVYGSPTVQQKLDFYDAVVVIDDRNVSGGSGKARVGTLGGDAAVGYCESDGVRLAAHELGHIYGASHSEDSNGGTHWQNIDTFTHDLMGYGGVDPSCNGNDTNLIRETRYWYCARGKIRETIRYNL